MITVPTPCCSRRSHERWEKVKPKVRDPKKMKENEQSQTVIPYSSCRKDCHAKIELLRHSRCYWQKDWILTKEGTSIISWDKWKPTTTMKISNFQTWWGVTWNFFESIMVFVKPSFCYLFAILSKVNVIFFQNILHKIWTNFTYFIFF